VAEPSVDHDLDGCGVRTHNPRDGVMTIVAIADGEEAFWDSNGNGVRDGTEPFVDQGEPFIDQDDDGAYTLGEWFHDVDGDLAWDPPNTTWDANTKIWTQTVVVYTGTAAKLDVGANSLGVRIANAGVHACTPTPPPVGFDVDAATTVSPAESASYWVYAADMNLNFLHTETSYDVSNRGDGGIDLIYWGLDSYADDLGMGYRYWPCSGGSCAAQCQATGGTTCTMRPLVSGFSCGVRARFDVTAGQPGPVSVDWTVEVPWSRYGTSAFDRAIETVSFGVN
jgi:hypothetical protein